MSNIQFGNNLTHSQIMTKQQLTAFIRPHHINAFLEVSIFVLRGRKRRIHTKTH